MSEPLDFNTLRILFKHGVPKKITLDVDKEKLRKDLVESGLDKRFVQNLIKVLGAGMTLDMDWEYLEDYDREEVQSRITRRTMLKPEIVSDVLDVIYMIYEVKPAESFAGLDFETIDDGLSVFGCDGEMTSVEIPNMVIFDDKLFNITYIDSYCFQDCSILRSIIIPDSVTEIGEFAFDHCTSLESITIPDSVIEIGCNAFSHCTSLKTINLSNSMEIITNELFDSCTSLECITIPDSVFDVYNNAFYNCTALKSIIVSPENDCFESIDGVLYVNDGELLYYYPQGRQVTDLTIPNHVVEIGDHAFIDCISLRSIIIPDSVKKIGCSAFIDCKSLESITLPNSLEKIGSSAFSNCSSLESIIIPDSISEIGTHTFYDCESLVHISIPDSVYYIRDEAFKGCKSLEYITIPSSVHTIGKNVFADCTSLKHIKVSPENDVYESLSGILYQKMNHEIIRCPPKREISNLVVPESVKKIWPGAFEGCIFLTNIELPRSIETISEYVFQTAHPL